MITNETIKTTTSDNTEETGTQNGTLINTEAPSDLDNKSLDIKTKVNGDTGLSRVSSLPVLNTIVGQDDKNLIKGIRRFNDPSLHVQRCKAGSEDWLNNFVRPKSPPHGAYSLFTQTIKRMVPEKAACRLGCGGESCKYESPDHWRPEDMAIQGIFSHWVTDSILACSRPTTRHENLVTLFHNAGIRSIFNLEIPEEHVSCGHGNHQSGFSYDPAEYMKAGIYIYNFAMEDYGTVKNETINDIMKVIRFAIKQGKVAVHCHAGLGRTGFIICSYLVHEYRMTAHDAIHYVRQKRPGSVQMSKQIEAVESYQDFLLSKRRVFTDVSDVNTKQTLYSHLINQRAFVHGRDSVIYKHIPRVLFVCTSRLIELSTGYTIDTMLITVNHRSKVKPKAVREDLQDLSDEEKAAWLNFVPSFFYENERSLHHESTLCTSIVKSMITSIREDFLTEEQQTKVKSWKQRINEQNDGIDDVFEETDPCVISALLWTWLRLLETPVIRNEDYRFFANSENEDLAVLSASLDKNQCGTIELFAKMYTYVHELASDNERKLLLYCIVHFLTHRQLPSTNDLTTIPVEYEPQCSFLMSEDANYTNKKERKGSARKNNKNDFNQNLLKNLEVFIISVANQFSKP